MRNDHIPMRELFPGSLTCRVCTPTMLGLQLYSNSLDEQGNINRVCLFMTYFLSLYFYGCTIMRADAA